MNSKKTNHDHEQMYIISCRGMRPAVDSQILIFERRPFMQKYESSLEDQSPYSNSQLS